MKIVHIINSLKKGGAEGNLFRLCEFHKKKYKNKIDITIITLIKDGYYEAELRKIGIKIFSLNLTNRIGIYNFFLKIIELRKYIRKLNPDIIQSWMYHSNFITLFIPRNFFYKLFWNIRHSELNFKISKKQTILISIICGIFSNFVPKKIIYCSDKSIKFHQNKHFYSKRKTTLIYNGYNDKVYFSSNNLRNKFRLKNKIKKTDIILGFAGRFSRQKNIPFILESFSKITKYKDRIYLYMVGDGMDVSNKQLFNLILNLQIEKKVILLNRKKSLVEFYNGIDLLVLASHSESFPNVVAESMLCSTPVLSSDTGCVKQIINEYGFILKNNDNQLTIKKLKHNQWDFILKF
jgi:glycosyltransferase involved in cell wall biosynthesis